MKRSKFVTMCLLASALTIGTTAKASDHDDGVSDVKTQSLNLTDLYVFREDNQTGRSADKENLILIMNSSPRSLPEQQYWFTPGASYQFHLTRVKAGEKNMSPVGRTDVVLALTFGEPDANNSQPYTLTAVKDGASLSASTEANGAALMTTNLQESMASNLKIQQASLGDSQVTAFAGLREDPFFFDVQQFFKVRAGAAGFGPKVGFLPPGQATDFTTGYNVNTVVLRVPISFLQSSEKETVFDVWETVFVNR